MDFLDRFNTYNVGIDLFPLRVLRWSVAGNLTVTQVKQKCLAALGIAIGFESFNSFFFTLYKTGTNQSAILGQVQGFKRTFTLGVSGWKVGFPNQVSTFKIKLCKKTLQPVLGIGGKSCDNTDSSVAAIALLPSLAPSLPKT